MRNRKFFGAICGVTLLASASGAWALSVTTTTVGDTLVNSILGSGITLVPGSVSYIGAANQSGTFTGGIASGIGIESGIILTSGDARLAPGPNNNDGATGYSSTGGDAQLNALVSPYSTNDAAVLQFDFTTAGGDLYFNYVFASEEYNEYVGSQFNDVFAFFLDGVNIAIVPGTGSTPVTINNVNLDSHPSLYNNNDPGPHNIQYDGFTKVFTAQALGLDAGEHTIKLAIADTGDSELDSAVFIQGNTFSDTQTPAVPEPGTMLLLGSGLAGLAGYARKRTKK